MLMFITHFHYTNSFHTRSEAWQEHGVNIEETEKDRTMKQWIIENGKIEESQLRWGQVWDAFDIARFGLQPKEDDYPALTYHGYK